MGQFQKAIERIKRMPKDYTYDEARSLLKKLGFEESNKGKTSGSRVLFYRASDKKVIGLHKPHPSPDMDIASVKQLKEYLESIGEI